MQMFKVGLFILSKNWKQPKYSLTGEKLCKLWPHPYDKILLGNKKEQTTGTHNNTNGSEMRHAK